MKINKIFSISIQKLKQDFKRNLIIIIPIIVITILLLILNMIQFSIDTYIDSIRNNIELRSISGIPYNESNYQEVIEKLEKIEHISIIVDLYERRVFAIQTCNELKSDTMDGNINIQPVNSLICPDVISGRKINDTDKYVIVLPDNLYASSIVLEYDEEVDYIHTEDLLGQTITIKFEVDETTKTEKTFEVIGIYDSKKYNDVSTSYVPKSVIKEINTELKYEPSDPNMYNMQIVVDDIDNLEYVEKELHKQNLINTSSIEKEASNYNEASTYENHLASVTHIEISTQNILKKIELFLIISSIVAFIVLLIVTNINKAFLEKRELGIMKIEGYTNKNILIIKIIENFFVSLISIIISIIIFKVVILILNAIASYLIEIETVDLVLKAIQEQLWYIMQIPQIINWSFFILISMCIIIIELINTYIINKRNLSKSIVELLKE